jgi:hypothetical protein
VFRPAADVVAGRNFQYALAPDFACEKHTCATAEDAQQDIILCGKPW